MYRDKTPTSRFVVSPPLVFLFPTHHTFSEDIRHGYLHTPLAKTSLGHGRWFPSQLRRNHAPTQLPQTRISYPAAWNPFGLSPGTLTLRNSPHVQAQGDDRTPMCDSVGVRWTTFDTILRAARAPKGYGFLWHRNDQLASTLLSEASPRAIVLASPFLYQLRSRDNIGTLSDT